MCKQEGCLTFSVKTAKTDDSHCVLEIDFSWCGVSEELGTIFALLLKLQIIITRNSRGTVGFCQTINFPHKKFKNSVGINPVVLSDSWSRGYCPGVELALIYVANTVYFES